jgi:hypothetical protein
MEGHLGGAKHRIRIGEAVFADTMNGAFISLEENLKRPIELSALAEPVVLGRHPSTADLFPLVALAVERTLRLRGPWSAASRFTNPHPVSA